jgi:hypothetical protein
VSDFNAFDSAGNAFRDSGLNARGRALFDLFLNQVPSYTDGILGGQAMNWLGPTENPQGLQIGYMGNASLRFGDQQDGFGRLSFTVRLWVKHFLIESRYVYGVGDPDEDFLAPVWIILPIGGTELTFGLQLETLYNYALFDGALRVDSDNPVRSRFTFRALDTNDPLLAPLGDVSSDQTNPLDLGWHRVIIWYDKPAAQIGIQIDNQTPATANLSAPIPAGLPQGIALGGLPFSWADRNYADEVIQPALALDEVGVWHNYVWTEAEREADWNGGAGTGMTGAVRKQPLAYWRFEPGDEYPNTGPRADTHPRIIRNLA